LVEVWKAIVSLYAGRPVTLSLYEIQTRRQIVVSDAKSVVVKLVILDAVDALVA